MHWFTGSCIDNLHARVCMPKAKSVSLSVDQQHALLQSLARTGQRRCQHPRGREREPAQEAASKAERTAAEPTAVELQGGEGRRHVAARDDGQRAVPRLGAFVRHA